MPQPDSFAPGKISGTGGAVIYLCGFSLHGRKTAEISMQTDPVKTGMRRFLLQEKAGCCPKSDRGIGKKAELSDQRKRPAFSLRGIDDSHDG